jgi:hypothetical protein
MNWIKIEPGCEMPEDGERVLCVDGDLFFSGYFWHSTTPRWSFSDDMGDYHDVTHWARLELPQ